jgi:outer membrane lipoprotein SlyB
MKYVIAIVAIAALLLGSAVAQQPYPQQYPQNPPPQTSPQQYPQTQYPQTTQQPATGVWDTSRYTIPAGTELAIRTNENIQATPQDVGRAYSAEISKDIMGPNGQVLVPRGSPAQLTIVNTSTGSMGAGSNEVALGLRSINVNGRTMNVQTDTQKASNDRGIGANKRTAIMTGGGAVLGTVIGAMAGGGKGALIGAVVGGAGGAAAQVLTRGKEVKVPAESVLTFKLDQPLTLQ